MLRFLKATAWFSRAFWAMSDDQRRQALQRLSPRRLLAGSRQRIRGRLIAIIDRHFGAIRGNKLYWKLSSSKISWSSAERRLSHLAATAPDAIEDFVERGFAHSHDAFLLDRLSWHHRSRPIIARLLFQTDLINNGVLAGKIRKSRRYAAVLLACAARLLPDVDVRRIASLVSQIQTTPPEDFFRLLDSAGTRLAFPPRDPDLRGLLESGFRNTCRHRLIISEDHSRPESLAPLFQGAERVTLIALNDTFGRADFFAFPEAQALRELVVEHIRSRVTRFSATYIENHLDTRDVARAITARLVSSGGIVLQQEASATEVAIADFLHFQSLKIRAIAELLKDAEFDHIVITTEKHDAGSSYLRSLAAVQGLATDSRIEVISISPSMDQRSRFDQCISGLLNPATPVHSALDWALPLPHVLDDLNRAAANFSKSLPNTSADQVLILTTQNTAYDASTASYVTAIARDHPVCILHAGLNAIGLQTLLAEQNAPAPVSPFSTRFKTAPRLNRWLMQLVLDEHGRLAPSPARDAVRIHASRIAGEVIHSQLIIARGMQHWFDRMEAGERLPRLVILSPQRAPQILPILPVARAHGVATLALEAHGLNANYCRYLTVHADYYGVISELFRFSAEGDFQIPTDRTVTIGTPRIIAPKNHEPLKARQIARLQLAEEEQIDFEDWAGTVSFFSQPSAWDHMAEVVSALLGAAQRLHLQVLLKPHPEETPSRVAAYRALAESLGAGSMMRIVQVPPKRLIEASDVVLTAYSAAAIDAAILQVPVICVTKGDVRYPVDQHSIIGAPLIGDVDSLTEALRQLCSDPEAARAQAVGFFQREPQFVEGPDDRLRAFVHQILQSEVQGRLRPDETLPGSFFLAGPHPVFPV